MRTVSSVGFTHCISSAKTATTMMVVSIAAPSPRSSCIEPPRRARVVVRRTVCVPVIGQFPSFRFGKEDMPRVRALFLYPLHAEDVQRVRIRAGEHRCAVRLTGDAAAIAEDIRI